MSVHEDQQPGRAEKTMRIGCGALLGIFFGIYLVAKFAVSSYGAAGIIIVGAICLCGYLALKYGDEFWYSIFGRNR